MPTIHVDSHEPYDLQKVIEQAYPTSRENLNDLGFADYLWYSWDNKTHQMERKQAPEFMSKVEAVEEQLHRQIELGVAEHTSLVIEGMLAPSHDGTICYQASKDGKVMYRTGTFKRGYNSVMGKLARIQEAGVQVYWTADWKATGILVAELQSISLQPASGVFTNIIRRRPVVKEYDPDVLTLMGVHNGGVGEVIGRALKDRFGRPIHVFNAFEEDIASTRLESGRTVGWSVAGKLLKALGRE